MVVMNHARDDGDSCVGVVGSGRWLIEVAGGVIYIDSCCRFSSDSGQCL